MQEGGPMPKKIVENRATWPYTKDEVLDESLPHTLADFIEESKSERYAIHPEGIPAGLSVEETVRRFGAMEHILLKPLDPREHYFRGWFQVCGRRVVTADGEHLFTIFMERNETKTWYRLRIEPDARELLLKE
jgi:hypothetical protein